MPVVLPLALLATCVFFPSHEASSFGTINAFLINCNHGQVRKALHNWSIRASNFSEVKQRSHMQVYSSRFPSRKPKTERWGQWISSQQCCNNRLLLLPLIRVLPGQNEIVQNLDESGYYKYTAREGPENVFSYVTLIGSWQSKHPKLNQEELPRLSSVQASAKQTMAVCRRVFSSPPLPSSLFWRVNLSLGIIFWLAPTRG